MKKFAHTIIILILAAVVFYTGTGVTIINYCCSDCKISHTVFNTEKHDCYEISIETNEDVDTASCPHCQKAEPYPSDFSYNKGNMGCTTSRISVDINSYQPRAELSVPFVWLEDLSEISLEPAQDIWKSDSLFSNKKSPPGIEPRSYLSLIRILLI